MIKTMTTPDWEKIYETYSGKVMGYIAARVQRRADAEDLCADVFEKAYKKMSKNKSTEPEDFVDDIDGIDTSDVMPEAEKSKGKGIFGFWR